MKRKSNATGETGPVPTGELSVIDGPRRRRAGTGAGAPHRANRSRAAQRAVNRRAARLAREESGRTPGRHRKNAARPPRASLVDQVRSMPFAVPVIGLVALGLVATLWLSTRAAQDSYDLTVAKTQHQSLVDKRDALKRTFESGDSAPELSAKAARLGLVQSRNAARLVVGEKGRVIVRGKPAPAAGRAPHAINPAPADEALRHIDTSKVEDSTGLPGAGQAPAPAPTGQNPPQDQQDKGRADDTGQQAATPPPAQVAPNVLPQPQPGAHATPGANARRNS